MRSNRVRGQLLRPARQLVTVHLAAVYACALSGCTGLTEEHFATPRLESLSIDTVSIRLLGLVQIVGVLAAGESVEPGQKVRATLQTSSGDREIAQAPLDNIVISMKPGFTVVELRPRLLEIGAHEDGIATLGSDSIEYFATQGSGYWLEPGVSVKQAIATARRWPNVADVHESLGGTGVFPSAGAVPGTGQQTISFFAYARPGGAAVKPQDRALVLSPSDLITATYTQADGSQLTTTLPWRR